MYADDVILLSETPAGLQISLSYLQKYCTKWGLEVNTKKTKSLIFNNTGKLDTNVFTFNNNNIENVGHYSYLGVNFSITGSFTEAKNVLYKKGLKAFFKIRKCFEHHKPKIKTILHVFDHTVKPVLLYGSEVWGIFAVDKLQKQKDLYLNKLCTDFIAEKIHIKLCKYLLEVGCRSTNSAVLGELRRFPLILEAFLNVVKYWAYLSNLSNKDSLVAEAYLTSKNVYEQNKNSWYKCVSEIFDYFGINRITALNLKGCLKKYVNKHLHNKNQIVVINSEHIGILKITLLLNHIYIGEIMTRDV